MRARPVLPLLFLAMLLLAVFLPAAPATADTFNVEIDFMVDTSDGGHSHEPTQAEIDAIVQMFACQGHTLNIEVSGQLQHHDVLQLDPNDPNNLFGYDGTEDSFKAIKDLNFNHADEGNWHYAIFAHQYEWRPDATSDESEYSVSKSSGLGENPGDDFVVTLGASPNSTGTPFAKAATLAHEFGHNLGLTHCGASDCSDIGANPPNLPSVMSYDYQMEGVRTGLLCNGLIPPTTGDLFKEIDYSHGRMCSLDEAALDEHRGTTFRAVDWDCDGSVFGTVAQDLSSNGPNWCDNTGSLEPLSDHDEWANITSPFLFMTPRELDDAPLSTVCPEPRQVLVLSRDGHCGQPALATESCVDRDIHYVSPTGRTVGDGSCGDPQLTVYQASLNARAHSAVVLEPGTYQESGTSSRVFDQPVRLFATRSAIIR